MSRLSIFVTERIQAYFLLQYNIFELHRLSFYIFINQLKNNFQMAFEISNFIQIFKWNSLLLLYSCKKYLNFPIHTGYFAFLKKSNVREYIHETKLVINYIYIKIKLNTNTLSTPGCSSKTTCESNFLPLSEIVHEAASLDTFLSA